LKIEIEEKNLILEGAGNRVTREICFEKFFDINENAE